MLTAEDLVTEGVLTVGLQIAEVSAPLVVTGTSGNIYGIDIDFASALADHLGLKVLFVPVNDIDYSLESGLCDIVLDAKNSHVGTSVVVEGSYYESTIGFFGPGEQQLATVDDLQGRLVGMQEGSVSENALDRTGLNMMPRLYFNLNEAFEALDQREVDYVLCEAYSGAYLAAAYDNVSFAGALTDITNVGVAVSADNANLQRAVQDAVTTVTSDGSMDIIRSVWVAGMPEITEQDAIVNVPIREGAVPQSTSTTGQNGSSAGANAVIL